MHCCNVLTRILLILMCIENVLAIFTPAYSQEIKIDNVGDSSNWLLDVHQYKDTVVPSIKISTLKDSVRHYRDSLLSIVTDILGKEGSGLQKDSLNSFLKQFPSSDSLKKFFLKQFGWNAEKINKDTAWSRIKKSGGEKFIRNIAGLKNLINKPSDSTLKNQWKKMSDDIFKKPSDIITIGGGFINYNYIFRSALDTPYLEQNMGQHMVMAGLDMSVVDIPFRITYYGRQSNSAYLRDYNDFRVELNTPELNMLRQNKLRSKLNNVLQGIQKPDLLNEISAYKDKIEQLKNWLNGSEQLNKYIESKHNLAYGEKLPDDIGDKRLVLQTSQQIVHLYEEKQRLLNKYEYGLDSLTQIFSANNVKIQQLKGVVNGNLYTEKGTRIIEKQLREDSLLDKKTSKLLSAMYAIKTLAIGRTLPNMSNLTVKNLNVTGLNAEYNAGNLYAAMVAGRIDFRSRDFLYGKPSRVPQYVYAASLGYGRKEGNHVIVTGYTGKKQIISNSNSSAMPLSGLSVRAQWVLREYLRLAAEVAQSTSPVYTASTNANAKDFRFNDNSNKAYNIQLYGIVPGIKTRIEGYYQKTGINFQNFTNYRVNANASTWSIRAEQYVWKKQLRLQASARKNDYSNPYVVQQYNTNTVFTSFSATFRRRNYPSLTVGYMPASQYTIVNNEVVENKYQTLNITMSHAVHVGKMNATSTLMYNRFYNRGSDSGFLYYNANYFYAANQFIFPYFIANIGYARTANNQYALDVMDGGLTLTYWQKIQFGFGVKINQYNKTEVGAGGYGNLRFSWKTIGDFSCWYESGYLPGAITGLKKNEWFTLSFTRYFNNRISLWKKFSD